MFLSTTSIRSFVQNENQDNTGFKKPGASKSGGLGLRTPFKDRSVNSVSPTSKYNSKLQIQKKSDTFSKQVNYVEVIRSNPTNEIDDIYKNDYAFRKEAGVDEFADIFPLEHMDVYQLLRNYVSGSESETVLYSSADWMVDSMELSTPGHLGRYFPLPSAVDIDDVPLPVFDLEC